MPGHAGSWLTKVATFIVSIHTHLVKIKIIITSDTTTEGSLGFWYCAIPGLLWGKGYETKGKWTFSCPLREEVQDRVKGRIFPGSFHDAKTKVRNELSHLVKKHYIYSHLFTSAAAVTSPVFLSRV
jgi:hypothetical protein